MLTVTPTTLRIMEKHIPADHPDWEVICNRYPQPQSGPLRGFVVALALEIAVCVAGYFVLHAWRLL
jgi:hypothetical protein